jgi:hypothetical protein
MSAAMTPPYPYGYGAEYVARYACLMLLRALPPSLAFLWILSPAPLLLLLLLLC